MTQYDPAALDRFVQAQDEIYPKVVDELRVGKKTSHWMWYIFPQIRGLGQSATSEHYGVSGLEEARQYLAHPVLGTRLVACCKLVLIHRWATAHEIFGYPDELKFFSSMTLFDRASDSETTGNIFREVLVRYYEGRSDENTLMLLKEEKSIE